jgi:hypothetical protein
MAITTIKINKIEEYLEKILEDAKGNYIWYRGESSDYGNNSLTPSLFRGNGFLERGMFYEFRCAHYSTFSHYSTFQWLCLMQHYELPTRLLDWTSNPLISLYFSLQNAETDGVVYSIDPKEVNKKSEIDGLITSDHYAVRSRSEMYSSCDAKHILKAPTFHGIDNETKEEIQNHVDKYGEAPVCLFPEKTNPRMIIQSSCFSIHGGTLDDSSHLPKNIKDLGEISIKKYIISKDSKQSITGCLSLLDINTARLFPEIEYTSRFLKERYNNK